MSENLGTSSARLKNNATNLEDAPLEPTPEIKKLWNGVHAEMRKEFGEAIFRSWLKPLTLRAYYHGTMEVSVPTRFMRDWIQTHYAERISAMCTEQNEEVKRVQIVVVQNAIVEEEGEEAPEADQPVDNEALKEAICRDFFAA